MSAHPATRVEVASTQVNPYGQREWSCMAWWDQLTVEQAREILRVLGRADLLGGAA